MWPVGTGHGVPNGIYFVLEKHGNQVARRFTLDVNDGDREVVAGRGRLHAERWERLVRNRGVVAVLRLVADWHDDGVPELLCAALFDHLIEGIARHLEEVGTSLALLGAAEVRDRDAHASGGARRVGADYLHAADQLFFDI